ncbi:Rne/Rng family ribonuclease [Acidisoma sp.]|uniref:Rne/Rng family ribonuclease n=1 Tax=Acidisoma sp. TaxID=1872115 RepID=UPI003B0071FF
MTKRMLIDATHAEETRVVVLDGTRLEDFDVETSTKKQIKGNIYLAKVIRVEPSLQAAFVEYGGNRHGFLAFSEIHPDYYQIPVADRQRLLEAEAAEARAEAEAEDAEDAAQEQATSGAGNAPRHPVISEVDAAEPAFEAAVEATGDEAATSASPTSADEVPEPAAADEGSEPVKPAADQASADAEAPHHPITSEVDAFEPAFEAAEAAAQDDAGPQPENDERPHPRAQAIEMVREIVIGSEPPPADETTPEDAPAEELPTSESRFVAVPVMPEEDTGDDRGEDRSEEGAPETFGGTDPTEENGVRRQPPRYARNYKIQEVIHRRQIMLIQVVKEERGTKGAALTTYLSLAGRYCVLMPNSPRGGGVSRKITSVSDRKRLREVIKEVDMPAGMGLIVRTAGANRPKPEIRRDCEYLLRLWDDIREHTLKSVAPALIYEEASLIKRAIRDGYTRDIEEVLVDGEAAWKAARDFMRMLTPQHASKVQLWRGSDMSLFAKQGVEAQLDAMLSPTVQLKSGGYLVMNQTEALVAIDVNSGRSTRERNIEETALRTNLEAADEAARQLRLRDLAGLIVIDFIDMESRKHNAMVERRLKDALRNDRARIQVGSISHFGLMEMSRQRLRPSLAETAFITCPHCLGTGTVRSVESSAIHVLRAIEDEGARRRSAEIHVHVAGAVAMYILNQKRERLMTIERTHGMQVILLADDKLVPPQIRLDKIRPYVAAEAPAQNGAHTGAPIAMDYATREEPEDDDSFVPEARVQQARIAAPIAEEVVAATSTVPAAVAASPAADESGERKRRRRRRRRGGRREENGDSLFQAATDGAADSESEGDEFEPWNGEGEPDGAAETMMGAPDPTPAPGEPAVPPMPPSPQPPVPGPGPEFPEEPGRGPELPPPNGPEPELPGEPDAPGPDIMPPPEPSPEMPAPVALGDGEGRGRSRRGRRGGRGRSGRVAEGDLGLEVPVVPAYRGPTPADPYAGTIDALFAVMDADADVEPVPPAQVPPEAPPVVTAPVAAPAVTVPEPEEPVIEPVAAPEDVVQAADAEPEAPAAMPAKPVRAPRARKPKATAKAADPVEVAASAGETLPAEAEQAEAPAAEAKPARRRSSSRTKALPAEALPAEALPAEALPVEAGAGEVPDAPPLPAPEPAPASTDAEQAASSAIKPLVIGVDAPAASKRQGWWKR